ncbi:hypothetical protein Taro_053068 [Colocasia esculenta]|uniref:RNase H type-1 domain-containing protein n=1 Tax=Colocasia esculenta TaxID=4460 RepID=A0A843XLH8_COLES|nr:hypothetical protein [Colocasia esculenta]
MIEGNQMPGRLYALQLSDYDIILGMDWLEIYGAMLDCIKKRIRFCHPNGAVFEYQGSPKKHWKSWKEIAQPKECGGLGVLNLYHMQIAFRTKMLWRALTTKSVCARFFKRKHLYNYHHSKAQFPLMLAADRRLWKQAAHLIQGNHRMISMDTNSAGYFWFDVWTGDTPLKAYIPEDIWRDMPDKLCTIQQALNTSESTQLQITLMHCPRHLLAQYLTNNDSKDTWVWCSTSNGIFSTKSVRLLLQPETAQNLKEMSAKHIINKTMLSIRAICISAKFQNIPQPWLNALKQSRKGDADLNQNVMAPRIVRWLTPPQGRLKLNVDGAFNVTTNEAGGGGILRDRKGNMYCAFANHYKHLKSILVAEAFALRDGLLMCYNKGINDVRVETDSLNLLHIVTGKLLHPWDFAFILQEIAVIAKKVQAAITYKDLCPSVGLYTVFLFLCEEKVNGVLVKVLKT